ncbi:FAD-binding protein [Paenibacillus sp. S150]|nr:FAD-binding protein [Paenibacillus sp. S150]MBW4079824.1 FAD-binding protein [Paenibacillus sp. S150]
MGRTDEYDVDLLADVLVLGGGPAGAWAAVTAAAKGARVVLADKGYCGSSGAAAASGSGIIYTEPEQRVREEAVNSRYEMGGGLSNREWSMHILEQTYQNMHKLHHWGYPFPLEEDFRPYLKSVQGPEYMRLMRKRVKLAGVTILDHSPALELLADGEGVAGAEGSRRQAGGRWRVRAEAVVIATGGCAFLSKALGTNVLTGDGYLLAAEAGAELSGMEFSNAYYISPTFSSVTKGSFYRYATFYYEDGSIIEGADAMRGKAAIAKALMSQPVYCRLDRTPERLRPLLPWSQSNFFMQFERAGIDPFTERFPITMRFEGTVRGTGGLNLVNSSCATRVPGLYAAGDAATRELFCGAVSGGGSHNSAWAMSSGVFAGQGAADYALKAAGSAARRVLKGLSSTAAASPVTNTVSAQIPALGEDRWGDYTLAVQQEVTPFERNLFRSGEKLRGSLGRLDRLWQEIRSEAAPSADLHPQTRQIAAMTATARWMYASALARTESRGMHRREDCPQTDSAQQRRLLSGGLDKVWVKPEDAASEGGAGCD